MIEDYVNLSLVDLFEEELTELRERGYSATADLMEKFFDLIGEGVTPEGPPDAIEESLIALRENYFTEEQFEQIQRTLKALRSAPCRGLEPTRHRDWWMVHFPDKRMPKGY